MSALPAYMDGHASCLVDTFQAVRVSTDRQSHQLPARVIMPYSTPEEKEPSLNTYHLGPEKCWICVTTHRQTPRVFAFSQYPVNGTGSLTRITEKRWSGNKMHSSIERAPVEYALRSWVLTPAAPAICWQLTPLLAGDITCPSSSSGSIVWWPRVCTAVLSDYDR